MQDWLLLFAVAITFIFGYLVMKKLDHFLEENHVVFFPEDIAVSERTHYNMGEVFGGCTPVMRKDSNLEIEPIVAKDIMGQS